MPQTKEQRKAYREKNHDIIIQQQKDRRRNVKRWAVEYKGNKCSRCTGVFHDVCYEFHHTNPSEKEFEPSRMFCLSRSRLKAELDKCILVCSNCHKLIHWEYTYEKVKGTR